MVCLLLMTTTYALPNFLLPEATGGPPPPTWAMMRTCAPGTNESKKHYPYCDKSIGFEARARDLAKRLNVSQQLDLFGRSYPGSPWVEEFNLKGWGLDHTCIHGLNKNGARNKR